MRAVLQWRFALLLSLAAVAGCELREVTIAEPEDIIVVEIVLAAGKSRQLAWLHRTRNTAAANPRVPGARIEVRDDADALLVFREHVDDSDCVVPRRDAGGAILGSCYIADIDTQFVRPLGTYRLTVRTADGRVLEGRTTVPGDFSIVRPAARVTIPPFTHYDIVWTQSAHSWVYVTDTRMYGLAEALGPEVRVPQDPLPLTGLSISRTDTTLSFPREIGLFERFNDLTIPVLVELQKGLPPGVDAPITVSAADRNYVNWVRGGHFNPTGEVRVPSIHGQGGTGVFGSVVQREVMITTRR